MAATTENLITGLRAWTRNHDLHVRAAVNLLIEHDYWLRRSDFISACVHGDPGGREKWINWQRAREFCDAGTRASPSEMAVLDLAVELGRDRFRFGIMGHAHTQMILDAVHAALGG